MNRPRFGLSRVMLVSAIVVAQSSAHTSGAPRIAPQQTPTQTQVPSGWPYRPIPVVHPELMAGRWEADDVSGTTDSLSIELSTQTWIYEERLVRVTVDISIRLGGLGTVSRSVSALLPGPVAFFENPALNTVWSDNHLRLGSNVGSPIELDLTFDEMRMEWRAIVSSSGISKLVRFTRPATSVGAPRAGVGYWCTEAPEPGSTSCVRIAEGADGNVHAWRDSVTSNTKDVLWQGRYGSLVQVLKNPEPGAIGLSEGSAPHFNGRLSPDGTRLEGQLTLPFALAPPNSGSRPHAFVKSDTGAWPASSRRP